MGTPAEPSYRQRVGYQSMLLGGFATFAAIILISGNLATRDAIAERQKEDLLASLNQVVPQQLYENDLLAYPLLLQDEQQYTFKVYRGFSKSQVSSLAWEISEAGYASEIRLIMSVDPNGNLLGVRVLSHSETPGLGDKIEPERDDWILKFNGLSLANPAPEMWKVTKDGGRFDAFSGATITPRAVVKAIKRGLEFFKANRSHLLSMPEESTSAIQIKTTIPEKSL